MEDIKAQEAGVVIQEQQEADALLDNI